MNEELAQILRAIRAGSPEVWQELVSQRVLYCAAMGVLMLLLAVACVLFLRPHWHIFGWQFKKDILKQDIETLFSSGVAACAFAIGTLTFVLIGGMFLVEAIAPLGRTLEMIR